MHRYKELLRNPENIKIQLGVYIVLGVVRSLHTKINEGETSYCKVHIQTSGGGRLGLDFLF